MRFRFFAFAILVAIISIEGACGFRGRNRYSVLQGKLVKPSVQTVAKEQASLSLDEAIISDFDEAVAVPDNHPSKPDFIIPFHDAPYKSLVRNKRSPQEAWGHWFYRVVWDEFKGKYRYGR